MVDAPPTRLSDEQVQPPVHAPIYDVLVSRDVIPAELSSGRLIEPEIMFRVDRDLQPRSRPYDVAEISASVTAVVGFEVIGSRFSVPAEATPGRDRPTPQQALFGALSDHLANGCVVIGDTIDDWREIEFDTVPLRVTEGERELISTVGCHPFDDPFLPVVVGVNRLRRHRGVRRGDIIVTTSSTSWFPVAPGAVVAAIYEGVGQVSASFAPVT